MQSKSCTLAILVQYHKNNTNKQNEKLQNTLNFIV